MKAASYLDWNEMKRVVSELRQSRSMTQKRIALLIHMNSHIGLRVSDVRLTKWSDLVTPDGSVVDFYYVKEIKTGKTRRLTLVDVIKEHILELHNACPGMEYVFCNRLDQPLSPRFINQELTRIKQRNHVKVETFSSHSCRKTFARRVLSKRSNDPMALSIVQEILNHSSIGTTRRYLGLVRDEIDAVYLSL